MIVCMEVEAYSIKYYQCHTARNVQVYSALKMCRNKPNLEPPNLKEYTLLQEKETSILTGYKCQVTESKFTLYCGSFSHMKIADVPDIEIPISLTPNQCQGLRQSGRFVSPQGRGHAIRVGVNNILKDYDLGAIQVTSNKVACTGQPAQIKGVVVEDILQVSQFKVLVEAERYYLRDNRVETMYDHTLLPQDCPSSALGCTVAKWTYIWDPPTDSCPLEKVRQTSMQATGDYLIDHKNKILIKPLASTSSPRGCPTGIIKRTEYPNIFITEANDLDWTPMQGNIEVSDYIASRDDYLGFQMEQRMSLMDTQTNEKFCQNNMKTSQMSQVTGKQFVKRNGDTIERFECEEKRGQIKSSDVCYEDIPLNDGGYVKAVSRMFANTSAVVPCKPRFGIKIKTEEQIWIELSPKPRRINQPAEYPHEIQTGVKHEDLSSGGLYTTEEIRAWESHLSFGDVSEAITKTLTYGVCQHQGQCPSSGSVPAYDLASLVPGGELIENLNLFQKFKHLISSSGAWLSLVVILIETIKILVYLSTFATILIQEGIMGLQAAMYLLCCSGQRVARKIRKRKERVTRNLKREEGMELAEGLNPSNELAAGNVMIGRW